MARSSLEELFSKIHDLSDSEALALAAFIRESYSTDEIAFELGISAARVKDLIALI